MSLITYEMLPLLIGKEIYIDKKEKGLLARSSIGTYAVLSNNSSLNGSWEKDLFIEYNGTYRYSWVFMHEDYIEENKNKTIKVSSHYLYYNIEVINYGEL